MRITEKVSITRIQGNKAFRKSETIDEVTVEYPVGIYIDGCIHKTLLCTPENLDYLAAGSLAGEGIIDTVQDIKSIRVDEKEAAVHISLNARRESAPASKNQSALSVKASAILESMKHMDELSITFKKTGGAHGCALCDATKIIAFHEDIGRHNAVDKVIGDALTKGISLDDKIILTSCRISSGILLKATRQKIPVIVSCSAPTHLAVKNARETGITLIGFARGERMNIYSMPERVEVD